MSFVRRCLCQQLLALLACFLAIWALPCARAVGAEQGVQSIPVVFHIAANTLYSREPERFIARQLALANATFAPLGIAFRDAGHAPLAGEAVSLETRSDRDALLPLARPGAVHCIVVTKLMDVDEPGRERRGVHWHPADKDRPHIVILSTAAMDYVLAHELAHYFGNPLHSELEGNVLSYAWGNEPPLFTKAQRLRVVRALARMRREREL